MNVAVSLEHRFERTPDGTVWTYTAYANDFWLLHLEVFEAVRIIARVRDVPSVDTGAKRVDGPGVAVHPVPHYIGPLQFALRYWQVRRAVFDGREPDIAIILRVPSMLGSLAVASLGRDGRPFGVEVVGDPNDVFAPGAVRHPLRPVFRRWFTSALRQQVRGASAAAYVTEHALQLRYPAAEDAYTTSYSSIDLPDEAFVARSRSGPVTGESVSIVSVGSLEQLYKAPDVLIDAVAICGARGFDVRLSFVGDGKYRRELEQRTEARGVANRVHFAGLLPGGAAVREALDRADLFVLPSRTEGLPRAMIEAMARGLPCIGTNVGGIPELLPPEDLVPPGDAQALADKIAEVASDPARMARMSARNLAKAHEYHDDVLRARRVAFYQVVRDQTETWMSRPRGGAR